MHDVLSVQLARVLRRLRDHLETLQKRLESWDEQKEAEAEQDTSSAGKPERLPLQAIVQLPEAITDYLVSKKNEDARNNKVRNRLAWSTLVVLTLTLGGVLLQWKATNNMLEQVAKQTDILRKQLIGTQAALIQLTVQRGSQKQYGTIEVVFTNHGHSTGTVSAKLAVFRTHQDGHEVQLLADDIPTTKVSVDQPLSKTYPFIGVGPKFSIDEWNALQRSTDQQVLVIKGTYKWNDGFDDIPPRDFCRSWLAVQELVLRDGTLHTASAGFNDCADWQNRREVLSQFFEQRQRESSNAKK